MNTTLATLVNNKLKKFNLKKKDFQFKITDTRKYTNTTYTWVVCIVNGTVYDIKEPYNGTRTTDIKNLLILDVLNNMEKEQQDNDREKFIEYVWNFYGKDGIYQINNINKDIINKAIEQRINDYPSLPLQYDSIDRELIRDIILENI
jgi:hypothetical protein